VLALVPRNDTGPGAGGLSARAWKGLSRSTFTIGLHCIFRWSTSVYVLTLGLVTVKGPLPPLQQLANVSSVEQLLGPQQHLVPHLEHHVDQASIQLRLPPAVPPQRARAQTAPGSTSTARRVASDLPPGLLAAGAVSGRRGYAQRSMKKGVSLSPRVEAALLMENTARGSCRSLLCQQTQGQRIAYDSVGLLRIHTGIF
jgi:hypothetical protein